jgi:polysaccharide export outer membrane protein
MRTLLFLAFASVAFPQARPVVMPEFSSNDVPLNLPAQKIGPNDLTSVSVYDAPGFTRAIRVGSDGGIRFPRLASRPVNVTGAVRKPLTFQSIGHVTLLDARARAEGLTVDAGQEILLSRADLVQRISVKELMDASDPKLNLTLTGGEEIRIPEIGKVFVVGNVHKPGAFPMRDVAETTVLKVLAMSEGLTPFAAKQAHIFRQQPGGGPKGEFEIELKQIMDRKSDDVPLMANDILYIPDNSGRRAALTVFEKVLAFGANAMATALV